MRRVGFGRSPKGVAALVVLAGAVMLAPSARAAVDFYASGGLGLFQMDAVNERVDAGNQNCAEIARELNHAGVTAECTPAGRLGAGISAEAGFVLSSQGLVGVGLGYQYLTGTTSSNLSVQTGSVSGHYTQSYTPTAHGPMLKVFLGTPLAEPASVRFFAGYGRYKASYAERGQIRGQVDDPDAAEFSHTYQGNADGYEAGLELRSALGPQAALLATVGYGWLQVPETMDKDRNPGPALDFTGLRLRGGLSIAF
ncbi:MAG: outer membrane beta-barrel protein [Limnochordaceae bacterium]|nr:outer membrane beta-barrel protein [Limnochordaceae bacterium]